jgi:hypothetical protein
MHTCCDRPIHPMHGQSTNFLRLLKTRCVSLETDNRGRIIYKRVYHIMPGIRRSKA